MKKDEAPGTLAFSELLHWADCEWDLVILAWRNATLVSQAVAADLRAVSVATADDPRARRLQHDSWRARQACLDRCINTFIKERG
jgi:hypothetical protein